LDDGNRFELVKKLKDDLAHLIIYLLIPVLRYYREKNDPKRGGKRRRESKKTSGSDYNRFTMG
jgi:hypothetical protein